MPENTEQTVHLVVGLGNPGEEYEHTRHNVGFDFIARLLKKLPGTWEKIHAFNSYYWKGTYAGKKLILQVPQTFMNLSGEAVAPLARAEELKPEEIMVVHDDMDLPVGKLRLRNKGSSGGHNGIKSIIEHLGTQNFSRIRIGIGKEERSGVVDFVLSKPDEAEQKILDVVQENAVNALILTLRRGLSMAMAQYNQKDFAKPEEEPEKKSETPSAEVENKQQSITNKL